MTRAYAVVGPDGFFDAYTTHPGREQAEHAIEDMGLDDHTIVEVNIATDCRWAKDGDDYMPDCRDSVVLNEDNCPFPLGWKCCLFCGGPVVVIEGAG